MEHRITEEIVGGYLKHLAREEYAQDTVKKYLRDIRTFAAWLEKRADVGRAKTAAGKDAAMDERAAAEREPAATESATADREPAVDKEASAGWKSHLTEKGYAPATINAMLSSLNGFFGFLGWEECKVKFLKIQRRTFRDQEKELSRAEYERLLETARENKNSRLALLLEAVCATGIRVSEVKYITVEALCRRRADISLKGKIRTILLPGKLCKKLGDYARRQGITSGEIFVTRSGRGISRRQIWQEMKKLCAKAGVNPSKVFPHNLRHLFARTYYSMEKDIVRLADILGHSSVNTTRIYTMESGDTHRRQLERMRLLL